MLVKRIFGLRLANAISGYAPQRGSNDEEKDDFWNAVHDVVMKLNEDGMLFF